jgi:predicted N-formylglutamate amidohydrolase
VKSPATLLLTCEHGGNRVPAAYRALFHGAGRVLQSHQGYDIGALEAARFLQRRLNAALISATVSRLVVDLNRSAGHRQLFSRFTRRLTETERARLLARHYDPYRHTVQRWIARRVARGASVLHVSVHSFTPVLDGQVRRADIGLLYHPARPREVALAREWHGRLEAAQPGLLVRRNYPYRGISDGFIPALRREFPATRYAGIEIEINQRLALGDRGRWRGLLAAIAATLPVAPNSR